MCSLCRRCRSSDRSGKGLHSRVLPRIFLFHLLLLKTLNLHFRAVFWGLKEWTFGREQDQKVPAQGEFYFGVFAMCMPTCISCLTLGCAPVGWRKFGTAREKTAAFTFPIARLLCVLQTTSYSATNQSLWAPQSCCW